MVTQTPAQLRARTQQSLATFNRQQQQIAQQRQQAQARQQALEAQAPKDKPISAKQRKAGAIAAAFKFIQLKAQGKRINIAQQPPDVLKEFKILAGRPDIRRVLDNVAEIKSLAIESGFGQNIQEFLSVSGFAGVPTRKLKPTPTPTKKDKQRFDVFGIPLPKTPFSKLFPKGFTRAELTQRKKDFTTQLKITPKEQSRLSELGFDPATISGRLKISLIGKDPILGRVARAIKKFEEKQATERVGLSREEKTQIRRAEKAQERFEEGKIAIIDRNTKEVRFETRAEFTDRTKGFSATQKFSELFGVKFRSQADKERATNIILQPLKSSTTKAEQDKAIRGLRKLGADVTILKDGTVSVDTTDLFPTSRFGNAIVGFTDALFKFALFEPFLVTGVVKKGQKTVTKQKQVKKISPKTQKDLLRAFEEEFKRGGDVAIRQRLLQLNKQIEKGSGINKVVARENMGLLLKELQRRDLIKSFVYNSKTGDLGFSVAGKTIQPTKVITSPLEVRVGIDIPPPIKGIVPTGAITAIVKKKITPTSGIHFSALNSNTQRIEATNKQITLQKVLVKQATSQFQKTGALQKLKQLQTQLSRQKQRQGQLQTLTTAQQTRQQQRLKQRLKQRLRQQQILRRPTQRLKGKLKIIKPFFIPLPFSGSKFGILKKPKVKALPKQKGYNAFAKRIKSQLFRKINLVPLTKKQAFSLAALTIDKTISATGRIKRARKPAQKPKLKFDSDYFSKNIKKFRQFKIRKGKQIPTPFQIIERRRFRLDQENEKQTIKSFRRKLIIKSKLKSTSKMEKKSKKGRKK